MGYAGLFCGPVRSELDALHVTVKRRFREAEPQVLLFAERAVIGVYLFPVRVLGADVVIQSHGFFESHIHQVFGEWQNLGFASHQLHQSNRVAGIVFGLHFGVRVRRGRLDDRLVFVGQSVKRAVSRD